MLKRLLTLSLAAAMVLSMASVGLAATDVKYAVYSMFDEGYLKDDDGYINLDNPSKSNTAAYGETIYFPLYNTGYANHNAAASTRDAAKTKYEAAETAYNKAKTAKDTADSNVKTTKAAYDAAQEALDKSGNTEAIGSAFDTAIGYANELPDAESKAASAQQNITTVTNNVKTAKDDATYYKNQWSGYVTALTTDLNTNLAKAYPTASWNDVNTIVGHIKAVTTDFSFTTANNSATDKTTLTNAINAALASLEDGETKNTLTNDLAGLDAALAKAYPTADQTVIDAIVADIKKTNSAYTFSSTEATLRQDVSDAITAANKMVTDYTTEINGYEQQITDATNDYKTKAGTVTTLRNNIKSTLESINNTYNLGVDTSITSATELTKLKSTYATAGDTTARDNAKKKYDEAVAAQTKAAEALETAETAMNTAKKAYDEAQAKVSDTYAFVYESDAVEKVKATGSWSVGKKYVDNIKIERVKATCKSGAYGLGVSYKIYCVAITIKDSTTSKTADIGGTVKLSGKSGTTKVNDEVGIDITIDYASADSGSDGVIYAKAMLFEDGNGFDEDDEFEFTFDEDDDCYFVVNTNSQKSIVLGFDCDYDDDIGDKIAKKNPSADLDFYNGNYARFSKTGTLYLGGYESKKYYVYSISSSGALSRADAKYDSDEEAFVIRTNTLGRYIVSTEKLSSSLTSSDDDESSSTTKTSTASATSSTTTKTSTATSTTTKTSTTTSVASKPASSTPASSKPASSSVPASSTASSSSSTETEVSSSEETSEEEPSSEEYEDVVIDTDEEEDDVPTKEGGISWLVWVLIFAGLAAVLIAVGVIFYTHRNSGKRML